MADEPLIEADDLGWEKTVERGTRPVAVMFYSPTCAFCHQMEPYFRSYAGEYKDSVVFVRINIMTNQWTAERYGVRSTRLSNFSVRENLCRKWLGRSIPHCSKR